jgi:hypothetical protein
MSFGAVEFRVPREQLVVVRRRTVRLKQN